MFKDRPLYFPVLLVAAACMVISSCERPEHDAAPDVDVLATVNGVPITERDLSYESSTTGGHMSEETRVDHERLLQGIVLQELAYQKAVELGFDSDPEYQEALRRLMTQVTAFKRKKLAEVFFAREFSRKAAISDEEAQEYYKGNTEAIGSEIHILQILRRDENLIAQDLDELLQGESFEEVAGKRFQNLPQTDRKPWDLGYLRWEQVPDAWWSTIRTLKTGESSGVIRGTNDRYWIIKLVDRRQNPGVSYEAVELKIKDILKSQKTQQFREDFNRALLDDAQIVIETNPQ
jgi:hypothetical protein